MVIKADKQTLKVAFNKKIYDIDIEKLLTVISKLEGRKINSRNEKELMNYLEKYKLLDEVFLEGLNKF